MIPYRLEREDVRAPLQSVRIMTLGKGSHGLVGCDEDAPTHRDLIFSRLVGWIRIALPES